jgi:restriction system protein
MSDAVDGETPTKEYLLARLQNMDPYAFEQFVADVWDRLGWQTNVVGEPGDKGIDVIAIQGAEKQLIQAKRYGPDTTVGSPEVQQYASLRLQEENVDGVTIVTTGTFSNQARELAPDLDVLLINGDELLEMIEEIDSMDILADHFEEIGVAGEKSAQARENSKSVFAKIRSWF